MEETLEYIDAYFTGRLKGDDKLLFEKRCEADISFAKQVSLYIAMRGALKQSFSNTKKKNFEEYRLAQAQPPAKPKQLQIWLYASGIAASILIALSIYFSQPDAEALATAYIEKNMRTLSVTMSAEVDSLAIAINLYNDGQLEASAKILRELEQRPNVSYESVRYLGYISLMNSQYDEALRYFERLENVKDRYANPGLFYQAVTRMKRSKGADVEVAKRMLSKVVQEKQAGHKEASRWLQALE